MGCGHNPRKDYINLEWNLAPQIDICCDITQGIPLLDNTLAGIFSEHCIEHISFSEAIYVFQDFRRILKPGGVVRIIVPDAGAYTKSCAQKDWHQLSKMRPLRKTADGWQDAWLGTVYKTQMQFLNAIFRQDGQHKYAYDYETMKLAMEEAGLSDVSQVSFMKGCDPNLLIDFSPRAKESLYVEGVAPS